MFLNPFTTREEPHMSGRSFRATTEAAAMWQPGIIPEELQKKGAVLGFEQVTGKLVKIWPYSLNADAHYIRLEGMKGEGKSTQLKSLIVRLPLFQARDVNKNFETFRTRVSSRKPNAGLAEYEPILNLLGTTAHDLAGGNGINIFGLFKSEGEIALFAIYLARHLTNDDLTTSERISILAGVHKMFQDSTRNPHPVILEEILRGLTLWDFEKFYRNDSQLMHKVLEKETEAFPTTINELELAPKNIGDDRPEEDTVSSFESRHLHSAKRAADIFLEFTRGFNGVFKGTDDLYDVLCDASVGLDWYNLPEGAAEIIESALMKAEANALSYKKEDLKDGLDLTKIIPHASFSDEEGEAMNSVFHARFKAQKVNKLRSYPTALFEAQQYHIQGTQAGDEGSTHRKYADEIEFGVGAYIIFKQPDDSTYLEKYSRRGLPDEYVELLPKLNKGQAILHVPGRMPLRYNHFLLPSEVPLINTTEASQQMNNPTPLSEMAEWTERISKKGVINVGLDQSVYG